MLQNHCKGTDFSPNNQKKTQKKITNLINFLDLDWLWNAEMAKMRHAIYAFLKSETCLTNLLSEPHAYYIIDV